MTEHDRSTRGPDQPPAQDPGGVTAATKASAALGLLAAFALAIMANVAVARNYRRFDWTSSRLYTLSDPTRSTLRGLQDPVQINVLLSASDPLQLSVRHLLESYQSETSKLDIRYIDPDRKPAEFLAFQQKYGLIAGRTQDGHVLSDVVIAVVKGEKHWFLTPTDLVDISEANEGRSRPRVEQGLTMAIRNVISGGERSKICFARGHGELAADEGGARGLGELKSRLERNNMDVVTIDTGAPELRTDRAEPWKGCSLVIVAGPQQPYSAQEAKHLAAHVEGGGSTLLFLNPMIDGDKKRFVPTGLETVAALGGVELQGDVVFEREKSAKVPSGMGETFLGEARVHPITEALIGERAQGARVLFILAQSLGKIGTSSVQPSELIVSSKDSFATSDFMNLSGDNGMPERRPSDREGPLVVAMASELPKRAGATDRGPRMVVVGSASVTQGQVWQEPSLRGAAYFVENAISWLTSRPQIVDIPSKPSVMAGLRLTEESMHQINNYVVLCIPLAGALVGAAVFLRRRSTERRGDAGQRSKDKA